MLYIIMRGEVKPCPHSKLVLQSIHVNHTTQETKTKKTKKTKQFKLEIIGLHKSYLHITLRMVTTINFYFQKVQTYKTPV